MNVVTSNENKAIIDRLEIDIIKRIDGQFDINELLSKFVNLYFNKMIIDITSIKDYENPQVIATLAQSVDPSRVIVLLNNNPVVNSNDYLANLINNGFYNFTRNFEGINFLYNNPNTFENVQHLLTNNVQTAPSNNNGVNAGPVNNGMNNNQQGFNAQEQMQNENQEVSQGGAPRIFSNRMIIGLQNVTNHAGASTLVRMMVRQLNSHGIKAYGIEMFRQDLMYYRDPHLVACMNRNDIERELRKMEDANAVIFDLNDFGEADKYCDKVMYLIEPSFIRLTKALKRNANTLVELKDANVVLNMSFVNNQELPDFEYETKLTIFDNIPPLNDRNENSIEINNFLRKLGYNIVDNINNQ
jgi:hypothetical protein